jgi:phage terminase small subunit
MSLNPKQKRFCKEYLVDFNATQAAIRTGYSARSSYAIASALLKKHEVKAYIAKLSNPQEMDLTVTARKVLDQLARLGYANAMDYYREVLDEATGQTLLVTKMPSELTEDQQAAIEEVILDDKGRPTYRLARKDSSLDKMGKHLKLFTDMDPLVQSFTVMGQVLVDGKPLIFNVGQPAPQFDIKNAPKPKEKP